MSSFGDLCTFVATFMLGGVLLLVMMVTNTAPAAFIIITVIAMCASAVKIFKELN